MRASRSPGFNASTCLLILATRLGRREPTSQDAMSESTAKMMNVPMEMNCIIVMKESVRALAVLPICVTSILVTVDCGSEVSTVSSCTEGIGEQTAVAELPTASGSSSRSRSELVWFLSKYTVISLPVSLSVHMTMLFFCCRAACETMMFCVMMTVASIARAAMDMVAMSRPRNVDGQGNRRRRRVWPLPPAVSLAAAVAAAVSVTGVASEVASESVAASAACDAVMTDGTPFLWWR